MNDWQQRFLDQALFEACERRDFKAAKSLLQEILNWALEAAIQSISITASSTGITGKPTPTEQLSILSIIEHLLKAGANPNAGFTNAVSSAEVILLLIRAGAEVNAKDGTGDTALFMAVEGGYSESVKVLLGHGADPNIPGGNGARIAPLMLAAMRNNADIVKTLLSAKADPNARDASGKTALTYAQKNAPYSGQESLDILLAVSQSEEKSKGK